MRADSLPIRYSTQATRLRRIYSSVFNSSSTVNAFMPFKRPKRLFRHFLTVISTISFSLIFWVSTSSLGKVTTMEPPTFLVFAKHPTTINHHYYIELYTSLYITIPQKNTPDNNPKNKCPLDNCPLTRQFVLCSLIIFVEFFSVLLFRYQG